jgi:hypothetical protein
METKEDFYTAMQARIDDGSIWHFEGSVGRSAYDAIHAGRCMLAPKAHRDYWGNLVPSRHDVVPGTPGSPEYVVKRQSEEWLEMLESKRVFA